uniref:Uncharacterized protein n=1 Tax=Arundo donax TaxID=35708 RepID=A0A0A9CDR9_ARUDO
MICRRVMLSWPTVLPCLCWIWPQPPSPTDHQWLGLPWSVEVS